MIAAHTFVVGTSAGGLTNWLNPRWQEIWDRLQFGLRLGAQPADSFTTAPKPTRLLKPISVILKAPFEDVVSRTDAAGLGKKDALKCGVKSKKST
jgi:phage terminase large subunit-like protein